LFAASFGGKVGQGVGIVVSVGRDVGVNSGGGELVGDEVSVHVGVIGGGIGLFIITGVEVDKGVTGSSDIT
jgi:hypothetical protein